MPTLSLYFVRHAPVIGQNGIAYGREAAIDETCTDLFASAAAQLPKDCALWIASDFPRAQRTARLLQEQLGNKAPLISESAFNEQNFGDLAGQRKTDIHANPANAAYLQDMARIAPPNGESVPEMVERVGNGLQALAGNMLAFGQHTAIIACHGGVIRSAKALCHNEDFDLHMKAPYLSVHKFDIIA